MLPQTVAAAILHMQVVWIAIVGAQLARPWTIQNGVALVQKIALEATAALRMDPAGVKSLPSTCFLDLALMRYRHVVCLIIVVATHLR